MDDDPDSKEVMVRTLHQLRGRARLSVSGLRGSGALATHLENEVRRFESITRVAASQTTGNVLVQFQERQSPEAVRSLIETAYMKVLEFTQLNQAKNGACRSEAAGTGPVTSPVWHVLEPAEVLSALGTSPTRGLAADRVRERRAMSGMNVLPGTHSRSFPEIFFDQMKSLPVVVTAAAAGFSLLTGAMAAGLLAAGVMLANAVIGSLVEKRAEVALELAREAVDLRAQVVREGKVIDIPFQDVVVGDLINLQVGFRVPADARVIETHHLSVDEAALTGESIPVDKSASVVSRERIPISQRWNMVYRGTLVVEGEGRAVVVATGKETVLGALQGFLGEVFPPEAAMARDMKKTAMNLIFIGLGVCTALSTISLLRGHGLLRMIRDGLSFLGGAIPSGLSTLAVSAFALGQSDLRQKHILVRRLRALGNLAFVQVVCFDKTGTLTHNRMVATDLQAGVSQAKIDNHSFVGPEGVLDLGKEEDILWVITLSVLCNEAPTTVREGERSRESSSTERALILLAERAGLDPTLLRQNHPPLDIRHRSEEHAFMVTLHPWSDGKKLVAVKGNPLEVLERCTCWHKDGQPLPLEDSERSLIEAENFRMAGRGLRVLGVGYRWGSDGISKDPSGEEGGLVWAGLVGLSDPVRKGAKRLIKALHSAGLKTAVITGDQSLTASYIGEELNLSGEDPLRVLDVADLKQCDPSFMRDVVTRTHVFARLNPAQKLQIVQAYQRQGIGVMMVGDGINDVLALKVADVGVAMGRSGTDIARKAADLVLEDDDLEAIGMALSSGRTFYENMRRSLHFLLAANHLNVLTDLSARAGLLSRGFGPIEALWTNLACLSVASEPPHRDSVERPLPSPKTGLLRGDEWETSLSDAGRVVAGSLPMALFGLVRYGAAPRVGQLFSRSLAVNQTLFSFHSSGKEGEQRDKRPVNTLLRLSLLGVVGGYFLSFLLPGFGKSIPAVASGLLNAVAFGGSALFSHAILLRKKPQNASYAPIPSSRWESNESSS